MTNIVLFIDTPWLYFAVLVHTYCMFASLFLVLVPTWFLVPQTSAWYIWHLKHWFQLYLAPTPLQRADVRQWNLHLLQGFITSGPFYLYCFFNCLLSWPYSSLVNTYIYNIHPCSFTLLFFKLDTHTYSCCLTQCLIKKYFHLFFNIWYFVFCLVLK